MSQKSNLFVVSVVKPKSKKREYVGFDFDVDGGVVYIIDESLSKICAAHDCVFTDKLVGNCLPDLRKHDLTDIQVHPIILGTPLTQSEVDTIEKAFLVESLDDHQKKLLAKVNII